MFLGRNLEQTIGHVVLDYLHAIPICVVCLSKKREDRNKCDVMWSPLWQQQGWHVWDMAREMTPSNCFSGTQVTSQHLSSSPREKVSRVQRACERCIIFSFWRLLKHNNQTQDHSLL